MHKFTGNGTGLITGKDLFPLYLKQILCEICIYTINTNFMF